MSQYCTVKEVADYMNWSRDIPEFIGGQELALEEVAEPGSISSATVKYLMHNRIIEDTLTLYKGTKSVGVLTALIPTTDYIIDEDTAKITITSAGATSIGSNGVYAEYSYLSIDGRPGLRSSVISRMISMSSAQIDGMCNQSFDSFRTVVQEGHTGKGQYNRSYRPSKLMPALITFTLSSSVNDSTTTIPVSSVTGLVAGMYFIVDSEVMKIGTVGANSLTVTRAQLDSTNIAHDSGASCINFIFELSTTGEGVSPSYDFLEYNKDYSINPRTGQIILLNSDIYYNQIYPSNYPEKGLPDRVRFTYSYGQSSVPEEITQACITLVSRYLVSASVAKGLSEGVDGFTPRANEILTKDLDSILADFIILLADCN